MKAVLVLGNFPGDRNVFGPLAQQTDLVVYGTQQRQPWLTFVPEPPHGCRSRTFRPILPTTRSGHLLWLYGGLHRALGQDRPDVVHVISEPWGTLAVQTAAWARRNPQTAFVLHGCDRIWWHGSRAEQKARSLLARYSLGRADGCAAESQKAVSRALAAGLATDAPTSVIHTNPRSPEIFRPAADPAERQIARERLGLPAEGVAIGFLGTFLPEKGPFIFFDSLRSPAAAGFGDAWVAIGGTGPLEAEVKSRARTEGVHFVGGLSYPDQVADFYRSVDVFVIPAYRTADKEEQGPRAIIEAMLCGCIVVGSACGAIPEMIEGAGVVVREHDSDDLARGIVQALRLAETSDARAQARRQALELYSPDAVGRRLVELWTLAQARRQLQGNRAGARRSAASPLGQGAS